MKIYEKDFLKAINEHKAILYKVSRMYFDEKEDQKDLFQEIILQLWKSLDSFKGNSSFYTWMYRVALNTAIVFFKKNKKKAEHHTPLNSDTIAYEGYDDTQDKQLAYFYSSVKELNKIEKALILQYIEGFSGKEIAKNLGFTAVNVRVRIKRVKEKLQKIIKKQGYEF